MNNMRIGILVQNISSLGGIEVVTLSLVKRLKNNNEVFIISCRGKQNKKLPCEVFYLNSHDIILSRQEIEKVKSYILEKKIEKIIVQLNSPHRNCAVANIQLLKTIKTCCEIDIIIHNSPKSFITRYRHYKEPFITFFIKYIKTKIIYAPSAKHFFHSVSKFCKLVTLCFGNQEELRKFYKLDSAVCHNSYEFLEYELDLKKNHRAICIGRLSEEKNVSFIIDAWRNVKNKKDWTLEIVGDGPLFKNFSNSIENEYSIKLVGKKSHEEVIELLKKSSVLLIASFNEGFPTVVTEAMNFGNAILTVHFDGFSNELLIPDKTCLISTYQIKDFAEKFQNLINNDGLLKNIQKNCYEKCIEYSKLLESCK